MAGAELKPFREWFLDLTDGEIFKDERHWQDYAAEFKLTRNRTAAVIEKEPVLRALDLQRQETSKYKNEAADLRRQVEELKAGRMLSV